MTATYRYADGQAPATRTNYSFAPFEGEALLKAWSTNRLESIRDIMPAAAPPPPMPRPRQADYPVLTEELVEQAYAQALAPDGPDADGPLWQVLRKIETTGRLYRRYGEGMRAETESGCDDLSLYLRFAEAAEAALTLSARLQFLNALLKTLDILCGRASFLSGDQLPRLARLVACEQEHVARIRCGGGAGP